MNIKYILPSLFLISSVNVFADNQPRHGYIDSPPSRAFFCSSSGGSLNKNCGRVQYEPQSVEGPKGFPERGPADGQIASGGNSSFNALNEQTATRWHQYSMNSGKNIFSWRLTAEHRTTSWRFFITKQNWDPNKPLERADFDLTPFCEQYDEGRVPARNVRIECDVPDRTGYQVILGVWDIFDTGNAFYQVIDADMTSINGNDNQDKQFIAEARLSSSAIDNGDSLSYVLEVKSSTAASSEPEYIWTLPKNAQQVTISKGYTRFTIYKTDTVQKDNVTVNVTAGSESKVLEYDINVPALAGSENDNQDKQFIAEARLSSSAIDNGDNFSYFLEVKSATTPSSEPEYIWTLPRNAQQITVSKASTRFIIYKTDSVQKDNVTVNVTAGTQSTVLEYDINVPALSGSENDNQDKQFIAGARLSSSASDNGDNFSYFLEVKSNTSPSSDPEYTWTLPRNAQQITVSGGYTRFTIYKTDSEQKDKATVNVTAGTESDVLTYDILVPALTQAREYDYVFPDNFQNYTAGTIVLQPKDNRLYQCRPYPYSSYCYQWSVTSNQYEPGVGSAWELAWIVLN